MWSKTYQCHVLSKHQPFTMVKSLSALIQQCFAKISEILFSFLGWMLEIRLFEIKFNHCLAELIYFHTLLSQLVIAHLIWEPISYCLICRYLFTEIRGWLANHTFCSRGTVTNLATHHKSIYSMLMALLCPPCSCQEPPFSFKLSLLDLNKHYATSACPSIWEYCLFLPPL